MENFKKFRINPEFEIEKFDNEILLYAISSTKGIYLNQTAHLIWDLCAKNYSIAETIAFLEETYPQQKENIREDVITTIYSLTETGALIVDDD